MGDLLLETHSEVVKITDLLTSMKNQITKNYKETTLRLTALEKEIQEERAARLTSEAERSRLQARVTELTRELSAAAWQGFTGKAPQPAPPPSPVVASTPVTPPPPPPPTRSLLLGNSLLRNVDPSRLRDTEVRAVSGATVAQLTAEVEKLQNGHYKTLYLVAGTRELMELEEDGVLSQFSSLIDKAKLKAQNVTLCSIPHRVDQDVHIKTDSINKDLKKLSANKGITFVDADNQLLLRDGSINAAALVHDGIHLSKHGVDGLIKTLRVPTMNQGSVYTATLYPGNVKQKSKNSRSARYFRGQNDVLSNFYPCSLQTQGGMWFHSSEQLLQYRRARITHCADVEREIMEAPDAPTVYAIAKKIPRSQRWERLKEVVIRESVQLKFDSCPEFQHELLTTPGRIVEDTPCPYWGRGPDYKGLNRMGLILEAIRDGKPTPPQPTPLQPAQRSNRPASHPARRADQGQQYNQARVCCANCGETNHTTNKCRYDLELECQLCHQYGHKSRYCFNLN